MTGPGHRRARHLRRRLADRRRPARLRRRQRPSYWHLYMNIGDSAKTVDLTPGHDHGVLYDGMTADGSRVFFTTADPLATAPTGHRHQRRPLRGGSRPVRQRRPCSRVSTGTEGDRQHRLPAIRPPTRSTRNWNTTVAGEENCGVVAVGGGGGVAAERRHDLLPLAGEARRVRRTASRMPPTSTSRARGRRPTSSRPWSRRSNAPLPPPDAPLTSATFGAFENPTGVAIDHSTGDIYVLDVGADRHRATSTNSTPKAHPISDLRRATASWSFPGMVGFYNWPTQIAVDNDPASPSYRDLYVPEIDRRQSVRSEVRPERRPCSATSKPSLPSGGRASTRPTATCTSTRYSAPERSRSSIPTGELADFTRQRTLAGTRRVSQSTRPATVYVVNGGGPSERTGHHRGVRPRRATGQNSSTRTPRPASRSIRCDGHVYVDEGNQVSEFDPSGNQVGLPLGTGILGNSISLAADRRHPRRLQPEPDRRADVRPARAAIRPETDNPLVIDSVSSPDAARPPTSRSPRRATTRPSPRPCR